MSDTANLIDRLGQTAMECRQLIRAMHEADQTLRTTVKDARTVIEELKEAADKAVDEDIDAIVHKYVDELGDHTRKAMSDTSRKIIAEFDRLAKPLMGALDEIKVVVNAKKRHLR